MKKCILPFEIDVEMRAYHNKSFPLGVFKANLPEYDSWLCNRFINTVYRRNGTFDTYHEGIWSVAEGLTSKQSLQLKTEMYYGNGIDLISFNKEMLKKGAYITGNYNEYYIEGKKAFQKWDFKHDYLLVGYDDEKETFKSVAYLDNGQYNFFDIGYNDYYKGVINNKVEYTHIEYYIVNKEYLATISVESIIEKLSNYLYSRKDIISPEPEGQCYGIEVWNMLAQYVLEGSEFGLDARFGRIYMEHKLVMVIRLQKLYKEKYLAEKKLVEEYYQNVYMSAKTVHHLFIRYNITNEKSVRYRISERIIRTNEKERQIIKKIIEML